MDATEMLSTRASNGKLGEPAPSDEELDAILEAALRAPDHALLRPWKILAIRGEARERLGEIWVRAQREEEPDTPDDKLARLAKKPLRAPLLLVIAAAPREHPKAPEIEQVLSAGAVAHGVLLGLHARGYAGMWRTGAMAYSPRVKEALGLRAEDHIVAYLYAGTPTVDPPAIERPSPADFVEEWTG